MNLLTPVDMIALGFEVKNKHDSYTNWVWGPMGLDDHPIFVALYNNGIEPEVYIFGHPLRRNVDAKDIKYLIGELKNYVSQSK